jgi:hypothetical protein
VAYPVDTGELDPAFAARMRALVVEEWQADEGAIPTVGTDPDDPEGDLIMLETEAPTRPAPAGPRRRPPGRWLLVAAAAAVVAIVGALLVTDDDDKEPVGSSNAPTPRAVPTAADERFCNAIDDAGISTPIGEGQESVDGALQAAELIAPAEIRAEVTTMANESRAQFEAGPRPEGTPPDLPSDSYFEAAATVGDYMAGHCGYTVIDVTMSGGAFVGLPAVAPAGKALIRIRSGDTEYHQVVFQRVKINETRSVEEILALPDGGGDLLDYLNGTLAPPGMRSWTVVELTSGRHYAAMCIVPSGSTSEAALQSRWLEEADEIHVDEGEVAEIRVP